MWTLLPPNTPKGEAMHQTTIRRLFVTAAFLAFSVSAESAEQRGVTDSEIRIGQTMPYSGALSAYSALGKAEIAYFNLVNDRGGINGRKIKLISLDDGYVPPRTVEQTRRLVESDEVALIFSSLGTAQNNAIAKYLQAKNVPQLFLASGASKFGDISQFPKALMGIQAPFRLEARLYAKHAVEKLKAAKIAVLAQNDDFGRDYSAGLRDVLESRFEQVVSVATYEVTEPTIDSQVVRLKATGRRFPDRGNSEVRGAGYSEGPRNRVEANEVSEQRFNLDFICDGGRRTRGRYWHHFDGLREGSDGSHLERGSRCKGLARVHGKICTGRRYSRPELCIRIQLRDRS